MPVVAKDPRMEETVAKASTRSSGRTNLWLAVCLAATTFLSLGARTAGKGGAYQLGEILGSVVAIFAIAAVLWTVIWAIRGRRRNHPWLSVWVGGIAVIIALLLAVGRASQASESAFGSFGTG